MNGSRLTASTAGTESTANTTSVASIRISTANSGVATRLALITGEQLLAVVLVGGRHQPAHEAHGDVVVVVDVLGLVVAGDLHGRVQQERAEDVEHPLEVLDQRHAGEDEDGAQDERPEDAPEQHPELVLLGHGEEREDHRPDEHVVDREALFDQEAGVVLAGSLAALPGQHDEAEREADRDPDRGFDRRFLDVMTCAVRCTSSRSAMSRTTIRATSAAQAQMGTSKLTKLSSAASDAARSMDGAGMEQVPLSKSRLGWAEPWSVGRC